MHLYSVRNVMEVGKPNYNKTAISENAIDVNILESVYEGILEMDNMFFKEHIDMYLHEDSIFSKIKDIINKIFQKFKDIINKVFGMFKSASAHTKEGKYKAYKKDLISYNHSIPRTDDMTIYNFSLDKFINDTNELELFKKKNIEIIGATKNMISTLSNIKSREDYYRRLQDIQSDINNEDVTEYSNQIICTIYKCKKYDKETTGFNYFRNGGEEVKGDITPALISTSYQLIQNLPDIISKAQKEKSQLERIADNTKSELLKLDINSNDPQVASKYQTIIKHILSKVRVLMINFSLYYGDKISAMNKAVSQSDKILHLAIKEIKSGGN